MIDHAKGKARLLAAMKEAKQRLIDSGVAAEELEQAMIADPALRAILVDPEVREHILSSTIEKLVEAREPDLLNAALNGYDDAIERLRERVFTHIKRDAAGIEPMFGDDD